MCTYPEEMKLFCSPFSKMGSDSPHFRLKGGGEIDLLGVSYLPPPFNFPTFGRRCGGNIYRLGYPPPFPPPPLPRPNFYFHPLRHLLLLLLLWWWKERRRIAFSHNGVSAAAIQTDFFAWRRGGGGDMGKGSEEEGFFWLPLPPTEISSSPFPMHLLRPPKSFPLYPPPPFPKLPEIVPKNSSSSSSALPPLLQEIRRGKNR